MSVRVYSTLKEEEEGGEGGGEEHRLLSSKVSVAKKREFHLLVARVFKIRCQEKKNILNVHPL